MAQVDVERDIRISDASSVKLLDKHVAKNRVISTPKNGEGCRRVPGRQLLDKVHVAIGAACEVGAVFGFAVGANHASDGSLLQIGENGRLLGRSALNDFADNFARQHFFFRRNVHGCLTAPRLGPRRNLVFLQCLD